VDAAHECHHFYRITTLTFVGRTCCGAAKTATISLRSGLEAVLTPGFAFVAQAVVRCVTWGPMRDIFEELFANQPLDPMEAARRGMRPQLRRRFYAAATTRADQSGHAVLLDGRMVRTPARNALTAPSEALTQAIAAEWQAQEDVIDPARMPLTRLANTVIDGVAAAAPAVKADVEKYLATDLLFYRAAGPERLVARQHELWDPVLAWARTAFGARFELVEGVIHIVQPAESLAAMAAAIPQNPWRLGAVHAVTTLTGSALIALALAHNAITLDAAWSAAHVDEDWNMELWGRDEIALERRAFQFEDMKVAATVLALS
jgi:chaperone required for assembly of F1-ATPase